MSKKFTLLTAYSRIYEARKKLYKAITSGLLPPEESKIASDAWFSFQPLMESYRKLVDKKYGKR